jgi:hypothetical protein
MFTIQRQNSLSDSNITQPLGVPRLACGVSIKRRKRLLIKQEA